MDPKFGQGVDGCVGPRLWAWDSVAHRRWPASQRQGRTGLGEVEGNVIAGSGGAMFGGEGQLGALAAQVEVGVAPAMEFAGTAQGLAGARGVGALAGVMDDDDGEVEAALQFAQEGKQSGDLGGVVLVEAVEADEGIEDEEDGA